ILIPGQFSLPAGSERYVVPGGGALLVDVEPGDRITVANTEGGQACELVALGPDGKPDAGVLDAAGNSNAAGLKALLLSGEESLRQFRLKIERRGINLAGAQGLRFFGEATPAEAEETFTAQRPGSLIVAAPGGPMSLEAQDTVTPLTLKVVRARPKSARKFELPDPLADPVLDQRVKSATAEAYFVKAGDYIQIIDVD